MEIIVDLILISVIPQVLKMKVIEFFFDRALSVEKESHVRRVIVVLVKIFQLFIFELHDMFRMSSAIVDIGSLSENLFVTGQHHLSIGILISSLHLIEDNSFEFLLSGIIEFKAPPLLPEVETVEKRT